MNRMKKTLALLATLSLVLGILVVSGATAGRPMTDPVEGQLFLAVDFESSPVGTTLGEAGGSLPDTLGQVTDANAGTNYHMTVEAAGAGEDGQYAKFHPIADAPFGASPKINVLDAGLQDWSAATEVWTWVSFEFDGQYGAIVYSVNLVDADGNQTSIPDSMPIYFRADGATDWSAAAGAYGAFVLPNQFTGWVRLPLSGFAGTVDFSRIVSVVPLLQNAAFYQDKVTLLDSIGFFVPGAPPTPTPPFPEIDTATIESTDPVGDYWVIWGLEPFEAGQHLGVPATDPVQFVVDGNAGGIYDLVVMGDGAGQAGQYAQFTAKDVPTYSYVNPILNLLKFSNPPSDWSAFDELWVWVDLTGFGTSESLTDFSIQAYEQDSNDGVLADGQYERYAVKAGLPVIVETEAGWKRLIIEQDMLIRLGTDFQGWVRVPFSSMACVELLGKYNGTFDLQNILSIVLGIPCDETRVGKSMKFDSISLFAFGEGVEANYEAYDVIDFSGEGEGEGEATPTPVPTENPPTGDGSDRLVPAFLILAAMAAIVLAGKRLSGKAVH